MNQIILDGEKRIKEKRNEIKRLQDQIDIKRQSVRDLTKEIAEIQKIVEFEAER